MNASHVGELRKRLEEATGAAGLKTDEKDPEEFINMLFDKILRAPPLTRFWYSTVLLYSM